MPSPVVASSAQVRRDPFVGRADRVHAAAVHRQELARALAADHSWAWVHILMGVLDAVPFPVGASSVRARRSQFVLRMRVHQRGLSYVLRSIHWVTWDRVREAVLPK